MAKYRNCLPQLDGNLFLTDGGIETTLIFHEGLELPEFAAFDLLKHVSGHDILRRYFRAYSAIATRFGTGLILESATWRASIDWGAKLGYSREALTDANRASIRLLEQIRSEAESSGAKCVISGCVGPRGDGYVASEIMSEEDAEAYHREQIETFSETSADMVCAVTMNYMEEAIGIARAARRAGIPAAISFTVETDGRLPAGESLQLAIERVDDATSAYPRYYMINCAHPTHFAHVLEEGAAWTKRIRGIRANASRKSHAQLNESAELDSGNAVELASQYARLKTLLPELNVMGGCCGTDHGHVQAIAAACLPLFQASMATAGH